MQLSNIKVISQIGDGSSSLSLISARKYGVEMFFILIGTSIWGSYYSESVACDEFHRLRASLLKTLEP